MAIIESASRDALFVITILRLIPRNKWISTTEIKQALEELGYSVEPRRLQRILRDIHKCDDLYVECNTSGKPYGYRRRMPDSDLAADQTAGSRESPASSGRRTPQISTAQLYHEDSGAPV